MQVIAPALYLNNPDKKITVWEIDNNNKSNKHISSKYLKYESIKLDKSEMAINDIEFSNLTDPNTIHVVDTGGSMLESQRACLKDSQFRMTLLVDTNE